MRETKRGAGNNSNNSQIVLNFISTDCVNFHGCYWLNMIYHYFLRGAVDWVVVFGRTDSSEPQLWRKKTRNLIFFCMKKEEKKLTQRYSCRWIVVQHSSDELKQLQMFWSFGYHITMERLTMVTYISSGRRFVIPVQFPMVKVFCFCFPAKREVINGIVRKILWQFRRKFCCGLDYRGGNQRAKFEKPLNFVRNEI